MNNSGGLRRFSRMVAGILAVLCLVGVLPMAVIAEGVVFPAASYTVAFWVTDGTDSDADGLYDYSQFGEEQTVAESGNPAAPTTTPAGFSDGGKTYVFYGWAKSVDNGVTYDTDNLVLNADIPQETVTANTIYRAMYSNSALTSTQYVLVSEPVDGAPHIVVDTNSGDSKAMGNTNPVIADAELYPYYLVPYDVALSSGEGLVLTLPTGMEENADDILWTFTASGTDWVLQNVGNNKYLTVDETTGQITVSDTQTSVAWTYSDSKFFYNDTYLRYNALDGGTRSVSDGMEGVLTPVETYHVPEDIHKVSDSDNSAGTNVDPGRTDATKGTITLQFSVNGEIVSYTQEITTGTSTEQSYTFPTLDAVGADLTALCEGHIQDTFIGWSPVEYVDPTNTAPSVLYTPGNYNGTFSSDVTETWTYYAVFASSAPAKTEQVYRQATATDVAHPFGMGSKLVILTGDTGGYALTWDGGTPNYLTQATSPFTVNEDSTNGNYIIVDETAQTDYIWCYDGWAMYSGLLLGMANGAWYVGSAGGYVQESTESESYFYDAPFDTLGTYGQQYALFIESSDTYYYLSYSSYYESFGLTSSSSSATAFYVFVAETAPYNNYITLLDPPVVYDATFSVDGNTASAYAPAQLGVETAVMPDLTAEQVAEICATCDQDTFLGWITYEISEATDTAPTSTIYAPGEEVALTADTTFYALFAKAEVTTTTGDGQIYRPVSEVTFGNKYVILNATYEYNAVYASGADAYLSHDASKYQIQQDEIGYYLLVNEETDTNYIWYLATDSDGNYTVYRGTSAEITNGCWSYDSTSAVVKTSSSNATATYFVATASQDATYNAEIFNINFGTDLNFNYWESQGGAYYYYADSYSSNDFIVFGYDSEATTITTVYTQYVTLLGKAPDCFLLDDELRAGNIKLYTPITFETPHVMLDPISVTLYMLGQNQYIPDYQSSALVTPWLFAIEESDIVTPEAERWSVTDRTKVDYVINDNGTITVTPLSLGRTTILYTVTDKFGFTYTANCEVTVRYDQSGTGHLPGIGEPGYVAEKKVAEGVDFLATGVGHVDIATYGTPLSRPLDVVLVFDASTSMEDALSTDSSTTKIASAKAAAVSFAEILLSGEGNLNSLAVVSFNDTATIVTGTGAAAVSSFMDSSQLSAVTTAIDGISLAGGTDYDAALSAAYALMYASVQAYGDEHDRVVVFMTDGAPTDYSNEDVSVLLDTMRNYISSYYSAASATELMWRQWVLGDEYDDGLSYSFSTMFGSENLNVRYADGRNVYAEAIKAATLTDFNTDQQAAVLGIGDLYPIVTEVKPLNVPIHTIGFDLAGGSTIMTSGDTPLITFTGEECSVALNNISSGTGYAHDAASNIDTVLRRIAQSIKIAAENCVVTDYISEYFELCVQTTTDSDGVVHYTNTITVTRYPVDADGNRITDPDSIEVIEVVTLTGTNDPNTGVPTITAASSSLKGECYNATDKTIEAQYFTFYEAEKKFVWYVGTISETEIALDFYVYLRPEHRLANGMQTYPTNTECSHTYTSVDGNDVTEYYPVPTLTWNGAYVYYELYLVNENGQPVDINGNVRLFKDRTIIYTTAQNPERLYAGENREYILANILADPMLSSYEPYDSVSAYSVTIGANYQGGEYSITQETGKTATVANGVPAGTGTTVGNETTYTFTSGSLCATYVSFPIVHRLTINPDVIVIDYGLGVYADVTDNDLLPQYESGKQHQALVAMGNDAPDSINQIVNSYGGYLTYELDASYVTRGNVLNVTKDGENYGTLEIVTNSENENVVSYTPSAAMLSNPTTIDVYYAVYAEALTAEGTRDCYLYSTLTIVPATVMYYDDSFGGIFYNNGAYASGWGNWSSVAGASADAVQQTSYANSNGKVHVFGYDPSFVDYDTHSLNSYHGVSVRSAGESTEDLWPSVEFSFKGTGFEVISDTTTESGLIVVQVEDSAGNTVLSTLVDNYFGDGALYQIPVISRDLGAYDAYRVKLTFVYNEYFASIHVNDPDKSDMYSVIDAIRIFNPIDVNDGTGQAATALDAYIASNEAYPEIINVKDLVSSAQDVTRFNDITLFAGSVAVTEVTDGSAYHIVSDASNMALNVEDGALNASADRITEWTFTETDDGYTISAGGYYLTVENAALAVTTTEPTVGTYGYMWTYNASKDLITGPLPLDPAAEVSSERYYALSYFEGVTATDGFTVVASSSPDIDTTAINGLLYMDGGTTTDPSIYDYEGPNNEVYVYPGSALVFQIVAEEKPDNVYVEVKSPFGTDIPVYFHEDGAPIGTTASETVGTATGMYYKLTDYMVSDWTLTDGQYYSAFFAIYNASPNISKEHSLSVCNIRLTYARDPGSKSASPAFTIAGYQSISEDLEQLEWNTYSPLFDLDIHGIRAVNRFSTGIIGRVKLNRTQLLVETSTDVASLLIRDVNGNTVAPLNVSYTDNDGVRSWTVVLRRSSNWSYRLYVTTVSEVFDMVNPTSITVRIPAVPVFIPPIIGGRREGIC